MIEYYCKVNEQPKTEEVDLRYKALLVIESLTIGDFEPNNEVLEACYKFAHVARGNCYNPHEDWKQELCELYEKLK